MTDVYTPRHLAPTEPDLVVVCWPGHEVATHQPFATVAAARRWVNAEHAGCPLDHRVLRAGAIDGRPERDVCGRDHDHSLSPVDDVQGGGIAYECIECGAEVVIEPDGTYVPIAVTW